MITVLDAIRSLVPDAQVSVSLVDQSVTWLQPATAPVSTEQIHLELQRLQQCQQMQDYQRRRAEEYPSVSEQLDALFHAGVFPATMAARIQAVKDKYPRNGMGPVAQNTLNTMSVEQWLNQQSTNPNSTAHAASAPAAVSGPEPTPAVNQPSALAAPSTEQWLALVQTSKSMTREQWLASQLDLSVAQSLIANSVAPTVHQPVPVLGPTESAAPAVTLPNPPAVTTPQPLLADNSRPQRTMSREEWLAEQIAKGQ